VQLRDSGLLRAAWGERGVEAAEGSWLGCDGCTACCAIACTHKQGGVSTAADRVGNMSTGQVHACRAAAVMQQAWQHAGPAGRPARQRAAPPTRVWGCWSSISFPVIHRMGNSCWACMRCPAAAGTWCKGGSTIGAQLGREAGGKDRRCMSAGKLTEPDVPPCVQACAGAQQVRKALPQPQQAVGAAPRWAVEGWGSGRRPLAAPCCPGMTKSLPSAATAACRAEGLPLVWRAFPEAKCTLSVRPRCGPGPGEAPWSECLPGGGWPAPAGSSGPLLIGPVFGTRESAARSGQMVRQWASTVPAGGERGNH
jgi:hypothetical protein